MIKTGYLSQAWLVILLAFLFGGALAGVQRTLGPRIAENRRNETYDVIPSIVPGADKSRTMEITVDASDGKQRRVYKAIGVDGHRKGWVIPARGPGFADEIRLLIGLDREATIITGIYVLEQKETPGLGALITGEAFYDDFKDIPTNCTLEVVTTEPTAANQIQALTGATISSQSVAGIVNSAVKELKEPLQHLNQSLR
ncbi:MAG: FMN-binding protein [Planctomycetota bacterium]|nr:FMN-binding protein [Planctomycetota bacterium]